MGYKEYSAKTLDEAITMASVDLGVASTDLHYEIIEKGSGGILGFGRKDVTISAIRKADMEKEEPKPADIVEEVKVEPEKEVHFDHNFSETVEEEPKKEVVHVDSSKVIATADKFLQDVFKTMDLEVQINAEYSERDNSLSIDLVGDHMGIIIGKRGQTLDSLQYLVNLAVNKHTDTYVRVKLDTEDYRKRRKETLENLARNIAYKVRKSGNPVTLEAMNPYERRTIHYALQKDRYVTTYSEGEEPYRHIVVTVKK